MFVDSLKNIIKELVLAWVDESVNITLLEIPHIPVTDGGHGNHSPPKCVRDGFEVGIFRARLSKVDGTRK